MHPLTLSIVILLAGVVGALALRSHRASALAALGSQALATCIALGAVLPTSMGGPPIERAVAWSYPVETITLRVDALSAFFLSWSLPLTWLGTLYAVGYLAPYVREGRNSGPQFALLNVTALSFIVVYSAQNALVFLLGWEIAAIAAWLMVIWDYRSQKIRFAGFNYLVSTHVGLFVLVAAFMLLHAQTGSMDFASVATVLRRANRTRATLFLLLGVAFAFKAAFVPFHTWLPRAHAAAPAHVSALMSGVIHKAGLFAFLRFSMMLGPIDEWMGWCVLGFGALSAIFGALYTTSQRDMKRLLGYSSTESVGIAAMGFGVGYLGLAWHQPSFAALGFAGGVLHVLNHAIFKCLLFYAAGAVYRATHTVDLERLGGLARAMPKTAALFAVGALAITGLPPLNGMVSELLIYASLLGGHAPTVGDDMALATGAVLLAFVGATSVFAMVRAFGLGFLGVPRDPSVSHEGEASPSMLAPMALHAAIVVLCGLIPYVGYAFVRPVVVSLAGLSAARTDAAVATVLDPLTRVTAILVALLTVTWLLTRRLARGARRHVTWGCGYTAATPRMQYTATSFSGAFVRLFEGFMPESRRAQLTRTPFPPAGDHLSTHHPDAVEVRIYEVLGQAEAAVRGASDKVPEQPRFAFTAGLIALLVLGAWLVFGLGVVGWGAGGSPPGGAP
jgi:hydrogenase-4 component B